MARAMDVIIVSGKMGIVYAIDKANGKLLWKTPVGQHKNDDLTSVPEGNAQLPQPVQRQLPVHNNYI